MKGSIRATFGVAAGAMALAAVSVVGLAGLASAQTGESADGGRPPRPQLTDDQKACLSAHGVTLPERSADGTRPAPPTDAQRAAMKEAAEACDLPAPPARGRGHGLPLTDDQKACLSAHGVTLPERSADGTRPAPPTDAQRAAMKEAAEACDLPAPPARPGNTGAQSTETSVAV